MCESMPTRRTPLPASQAMVSGANAEKFADHSVGAFAQVRTSTRAAARAAACSRCSGVISDAFADRVNDAAGSEERIQIDLADRGGLPAVVQRRIGMRRRGAATS